MKLFFLFVVFSAILVFVVWVTIKVDDWKKGITGGRNVGKTATNDVKHLEKAELGKGINKYSDLVFSYKGNTHWLFETFNPTGYFQEVTFLRALDKIDQCKPWQRTQFGSAKQMEYDEIGNRVKLLRLQYGIPEEADGYNEMVVGEDDYNKGIGKLYTLILLGSCQK
ncbi:hypothetical protein [uncultured Parabacteroides sp.]|uniref:hypothetical protein n=1 Tax=uncultured Parabacteroides sp. TaxID=512312 RepID=UPI0025D8B0F5|nr:hypothetical protein [uncultured Parabacteroides sp.]